MVSLKAVFRIRTGLNKDPDPDPGFVNTFLHFRFKFLLINFFTYLHMF
jgi:hypothetical protein